MRPSAPVHYLRPNERQWSPPAVLCFDTEARVVPGSEPETLTLRCWDGHFTDRRTRRGTAARDEWGSGHTRGELAAWVDHVTRNRPTVWCFAHNLGFDLATTRLPLELRAHGWRVTDMSIGGKSPWVRLSKGSRRLVLADSWSWLPYPLAEIGARMAIPKPALPAEGDDAATWHVRCRADVTICETGMLELMDWWDRNGRGNWTITGPQCGWNAYRHTPAGERVVIDPAREPVAADRLAVHGGRRGTWRIGEHRAGPFLELDLVSAYPTVAAHLPLPVGRGRTFARLDIDDRLIGGDRWGITARVRIKTDVPRWPVRLNRRTWYPVGEFWADLAGPDIAEARRLGCLVEVGPGQVHRLGRAMAPWASWCLATQNGEHPDSPPAARMACKSWGRSTIGKWAARSFDKIKLGPSPHLDWSYEEGYDHSAGVPGGMVDVGGTRWWVAASADPENAYPAVLAWVEAEVRTRLNRAVEAIGDGAVLQCDTDGLIVAQRTLATAAAHGHLRAPHGATAGQRLNFVLDNLDPVIAPLQLRVKQAVDHVTVLGPQHLVVGGQRRFSGLPRTAQELEPGRFMARTWPGLQWQMRHGSPAGYVRPLTFPQVKGPYPTGWILADGAVRPLEVRIGVSGGNHPVAWQQSSYVALGARLGPLQHKFLAELW